MELIHLSELVVTGCPHLEESLEVKNCTLPSQV